MANQKRKTSREGNEATLMDENSERRTILQMLGKAVLMFSIPFSLASRSKSALAQQAGPPPSIIDALNFALLLKRAEVEFYNRALEQDGLISNSASRSAVTLIRAQEEKHVAFLEDTLGEEAEAAPNFDFTAGGMLSPFASYDDFIMLAQGLEDAGVRGLKGRIGQFTNASQNLIDGMLQMHSLEARHAAKFRRLRNAPAWMQRVEEGSFFSSLYAGEDNTFHAQADLSEELDYPNKVIAEAFDEPLPQENAWEFLEQFTEEA